MVHVTGVKVPVVTAVSVPAPPPAVVTLAAEVQETENVPPPTASLTGTDEPWHIVRGLGLMADGEVLMVTTKDEKQPEPGLV